MRILLGKALAGRNQVVILVDRLDEPWRPHHGINYLADLLTGLLKVSADIADDLRHGDSRKLSVKASISIFLRSDIFYHVQRVAPEQDKLPVQYISWNDADTLMNLADTRMSSSLNWNFASEQIWKELFCEEVGGISPRDFISTWSIQRPRDMIYFVREAIAAAVNRGHKAVMEEDLYAARRRCSEFAFRAVLAEDDPTRGKLEAVLFEFAGSDRQLAYSAVRSMVMAAGVAGDDVEFYIHLLCDLNFLAIERGCDFAFARDEGERRMLREVARRVALRGSGPSAEEHYRIGGAVMFSRFAEQLV